MVWNARSCRLALINFIPVLLKRAFELSEARFLYKLKKD